MLPNTRFVRVHPATALTGWQTLKIGAGGFITGIDIAADGTRVIRCDTYGGYYWNGSTWVQLVTADTMPAGDQAPFSPFGIYEIVIAPSNTSRFYMLWGSNSVSNGHCYRSDNRGVTWTQCGSQAFVFSPNDTDRYTGKHMLVDPANADVVYAGIPGSGCWRSTDAGSTWTNLSPGTIPSASGRGYIMIADTAGGTQGSGSTLRTKRLYVCPAGSQMYKTTDGGTTFAATSGGPTDVKRICTTSNGSAGVESTMYATSGGYGATVGPSRYISGTWSTMAVPTGWGSWAATNWDPFTITADPADANHVVMLDEGGRMAVTYDGGAAGGNYDSQNYSISTVPPVRTAADIPWLAWTTESFMSAAECVFDPTLTRTLYFAEGIGVWYATVPATSGLPTTISWTSQSAGIEQLVVNQIIKPPSGSILIGVWDRATFVTTTPDTYPSVHYPDNLSSGLSHTWGIDYSGQVPTFIAAATYFGGHAKSAYTTDGGANWTVMTNPTSYWFGGGIACSGDPAGTNHIVGITANQWPVYSDNKGTSWTQPTITGLTVGGSDLSGFCASAFLCRQSVAADKVNAAKYWLLYTPVTRADGVTGIYRSTDGGHNWAIDGFNWHLTDNSSDFYKAMHYGGFNDQLSTVPGHEGHLFYTPGQNGSNPDSLTPADQTFVRTKNDGTTWTVVANVKEVYKFGFGPTVGSYTRVYIYGWVSNVLGLWYSDDDCTTWTAVSGGDFPNRNLDGIQAICGDPDDRTKIYVGFIGSGCVYHNGGT